MDTNTDTKNENTNISPDDPTAMPGEGPSIPQDKSGEDTGETGEVQAEAAIGTDEPKVEAAPAAPPQSDLPEWLQQISRYHDGMNGLLAGKENLKIMAINITVRPSFYKKWVYEANQFARLTINLRHRRGRALARLKRAQEEEQTKKAG